MSVGTNVTRVDAYEKVTGRAKFTDDYILDRCLVAKVCHSTRIGEFLRIVYGILEMILRRSLPGTR